LKQRIFIDFRKFNKDKTKPIAMDKEVNVVIRIMPNADDVDVSLPLNATPSDVIETLLEAGLGTPRVDQQGNAISYQLVPKGSNAAIGEEQTLGEGKIQAGDIILMIPRVIAGVI
jgi:hypothetical protein